MSTFNVGDRVQVMPHTDAFMQGDRYGTVERVLSRSPERVSIRMDRSTRLRTFRTENVAPIAF